MTYDSRCLDRGLPNGFEARVELSTYLASRLSIYNIYPYMRFAPNHPKLDKGNRTPDLNGVCYWTIEPLWRAARTWVSIENYGHDGEIDTIDFLISATNSCTVSSGTL